MLDAQKMLLFGNRFFDLVNPAGYTTILRKQKKNLRLRLSQLDAMVSKRSDEIDLLYLTNARRILESGWLDMWFFEETPGKLRIQGHILPPLGCTKPFFVSINGEKRDGFQYHLPTLPGPEYTVLRTLYPNAYFDALIDLEKEGLSGQTLRLSLKTEDGFQQIPWWRDYFWRSDRHISLPYPGETEQKHISGFHHDQLFHSSGATFIEKLDLTTKRYVDKALLKHDRVLDWGCGCGSIIRQFPKEFFPKLAGADIDPLTTNWAKKNIPGVDFQLVKTAPPTPFEDGSFDLVFGRSVFSHLQERDQFAWLAELSRITKKGGLVLVTIQHDISWLRAGVAPRRWQELYENGFVDVGINPDGVDVFDPGFYHDVWHSKNYLWQYWSKYFDILDILDGFYHFQGAVVLRRR